MGPKGLRGVCISKRNRAVRGGGRLLRVIFSHGSGRGTGGGDVALGTRTLGKSRKSEKLVRKTVASGDNARKRNGRVQGREGNAKES